MADIAAFSCSRLAGKMDKCSQCAPATGNAGPNVELMTSWGASRDANHCATDIVLSTLNTLTYNVSPCLTEHQLLLLLLLCVELACKMIGRRLCTRRPAKIVVSITFAGLVAVRLCLATSACACGLCVVASNTN